MSDEVSVRLHFREKDGTIRDAEADYDLSYFGGFLPMVGDVILDGNAADGVDRTAAKNRRMWTVVQRVFNPRENNNYVALIVEERLPLPTEAALLPQG